MERRFYILVVTFVAGLFFPGCQEPGQVGTSQPCPGYVHRFHSASDIELLPLSEFVETDEGQTAGQVKVFVSVLDSFGCQVKVPGVFRFELYEKVARSAQPKGKRVALWSDIDLREPVVNNSHWRDFLRAYEFSLDFEPSKGTDYILQATCMCPGDVRLSDEMALSYD
jgi:hypothetical protein